MNTFKNNIISKEHLNLIQGFSHLIVKQLTSLNCPSAVLTTF